MAKKRTFTCGTNAGNAERAGWAHIARLDSQSECRIRFISLACVFSHTTKIDPGYKNQRCIELNETEKHNSYHGHNKMCVSLGNPFLRIFHSKAEAKSEVSNDTHPRYQQSSKISKTHKIILAFNSGNKRQINSKYGYTIRACSHWYKSRLRSWKTNRKTQLHFKKLASLLDAFQKWKTIGFFLRLTPGQWSPSMQY